MERQILHIDVNNAFLSWTAIEMLKNGSNIDIREIPAVIGGDEAKRSGIVLAKSMLAKKCGVRTAETIYSAKKKCPNLKIFPSCGYRIYKDYSNKLYNMLLEYTDQIERFSIDECFLDMTGYLMNSTLLEKAYEISKRVREELGFTVNIGVSHNKLLAKMASDFEKPDKVHTLFENEIEKKMWELPVSELFMLGKKTVPKLNNMHIYKIGDLAQYDENEIIKKFGKHRKNDVGICKWHR
ncbi:MAG: DNA polymerase IV [Clostridia bacterium]|nr:DNA polymerase IV [Clostridia bacterium]